MGFNSGFKVLTSTIDGGGWSTPHSDRLNSVEKDTMSNDPLCRRLSGDQSQSGLEHESPIPQEFDPQTVQSVASHYVDYTISGYVGSRFFRKADKNLPYYTDVEKHFLPHYSFSNWLITSCCWVQIFSLAHFSQKYSLLDLFITNMNGMNEQFLQNSNR